MIGRVRLALGPAELEHDRDYGIDRRTGWTAVWEGRVLVQFVSLPRAVYALARCWWGTP